MVLIGIHVRALGRFWKFTVIQSDHTQFHVCMQLLGWCESCKEGGKEGGREGGERGREG